MVSWEERRTNGNGKHPNGNRFEVVPQTHRHVHLVVFGKIKATQT